MRWDRCRRLGRGCGPDRAVRARLRRRRRVLRSHVGCGSSRRPRRVRRRNFVASPVRSRSRSASSASRWKLPETYSPSVTASAPGRQPGEPGDPDCRSLAVAAATPTIKLRSIEHRWRRALRRAAMRRSLKGESRGRGGRQRSGHRVISAFRAGLDQGHAHLESASNSEPQRCGPAAIGEFRRGVRELRRTLRDSCCVVVG